ncbi:MAG TPA: tetratricopeptide repeat protein [Polyangia bacterium]|nr:tetratricopeptide repeat protein [Polyangia bacterium]
MTSEIRSLRALARAAALATLAALTAAPSLARAAGEQTTPANSGKARYQKQEKEIQGTQQTNLTKPQAPPPQKKETGPTITVDQFIFQKQSEIQKIVDQQIIKMRRLIAVTQDDDPQKPDFHFRLAELYADKQRFYFSSARGLDQKIFDAPPAQKATLQKQQKGYEDLQQKWLLEAVKSYIQATKFKKYERMDEVLFKLAYLLTSVKKEDQAREFFLRLIKDYPNSKYIPDAYLSFAEFYFDKADMDAALKFYEKVEQFPKSSVYPYAVYKKGWCYVNMGDYKTALETFVGVVRMTQEGKVNVNAAQKQALQKEAKKDIVKAYAHVGGPDKAWEFFQRTGGDFAPKMMEALAELYWEQGKFPDSTRVYRKVISMNMDSPRICEWQNKIVRNTLSSGSKRDQVQEIERLGAVYDKVGEMKQGVKKDQMEECRNAFHDTAKELALIWHKEAQRTKNSDTYALDKYVYKVFLDHFPSDKDAYDMSFYYGELLWTLENWKDAAEQYTKVVEMNPKGKYVKDAAYAAVLAWKNALNVDDHEQREAVENDRKEKKEGGKEITKLEPMKIPEYQQKMINAFDTYLKYVPDAKETVTIMYRRARIFYEYNHFAEAAPLFQEIVDKHCPDPDGLSLYSANLLLDSLNAQGKTKDVLANVDKFLDKQCLMQDPQFGKDMISLKSDSYDLEGREFEKLHNFKECGRSMLASAESLPEHPKHAERLWNAGQCFQNAHLVGQALKARLELIKDHPKDPLAQKALFRVAAGYHQLAYYSKAAENYEDFATKFPGEKKANDALGNATTFRIGLGESDKALSDMKSYVEFYGKRKPQDAAGVYFQMADVYEKDKRYDELAKHLESYLKLWGAQGGPDRQILAHFRLGEMAWKASCPKSSEDGACLEIKRVTATGRQKVLADLNRKLKKGKKVHEKSRTQCGPPTKSKITLFDRQKAQAAKAQEHFAAVLKIWNKGAAASKITGKDVEARAGSAAYAVAGSAFYIAEVSYEAFLRIKFPEGLDFQQPSSYDTPKKAAAKKKKAEESGKKFNAYLDEKAKALDKARTQYLDVFGMKQAQWTIASAARVGQIYSDFAGQLYTAEIPKDLKEQDEWGNRPREIFCDALEDKAEPIEAKAVDGFEKCLKAATEQSWYNEWSRLCERELNQMKPSEYPLASEVKPEAGYVSTNMSPTPVVGELSEAVQTKAGK